MASRRRFGGTAAALIFLFVAVVTCIGTMPAPAVAQSGVVRSIEVEGNRRIEDATVRSYMLISAGDRYDAALVNDSLKALFDTGLFSDVSIDRRGSTLVVQVVENPLINRVVFEGNRKFSNETLANEVTAKARTVFTRARVQNDLQRLITIYRRSGRFATRIEPKIIELPQDRVNLVFEIDEGETTAISRINFIGNVEFSDSDLRDVIATAESSWWDDLVGSGESYDPDKLNFDRELLRRHYLKSGYADFRVVSAVAELDREQENFFITFTVDEGERYNFGVIELDSSLTSLPLDLVESQILTFEGDVYNAELVDKTIENMTLEAGKVGFAFVEVRPRPRRDPINRTIDITYLIDDGPRVYVERIDISGNVRTLDHVIRREFRLAEGDAFNRTLLNKARRNLQGLGFFEAIEIDTEEGSAPDRIIIRVRVAEKSTGDLSFGAGYSTVDSVTGEISLTERNLMGRGQFVRVSTSLSANRQQYNFSFREPYFLDRKIGFGFDIFSTEADQDESSFESRQIGAGVKFGFQLQENLFLNTLYSISREELFGVDATTASIAVQQAVGESTKSLVGYSLIYDTLNSPIKPTDGIKAKLVQDFAGLGGDVRFLRTSGDVIVFRELAKDVVGQVSVEGGHIFGWGGNDVRLFDAYFKGGETLRGFARSGIGPRDAVTGDALGGKTFAAASAEVTFPLGLPEELGIRGAAFTDVGTLFGTDITSVGVNDSSSPRVTAGVSLLWDSPLGPLRFDFAEALVKQNFDETEFFRFSGGVRF